MCQSLAQGGQRCAAHTRPRYQQAQFGTPEWDAAAAAYASTPTGRMELAASLAAAEAADDVRSAVAFEHAMAEGQRLREKAELFREELATRTAPAPVEEAPEPVFPAAEAEASEDDEYEYEDDYDGGAEFGYEYTDEEEFEASPYRDWSPSMGGYRWDTSDPTFRGCTHEMDTNQFIDQVCENTGITRAEFEEAAAAYFARHDITLLSPHTTPTTHATPTLVAAGPEHLRTLIAGSFSPGYTPEQIREIAQLARKQREQATTDEASAAPAAPRPQTPRELVASHNDPTELAAFADSDDPELRALVAGHENTPADVLDRLATSDPKAEVRASAARNPNLPAERILALATDRSIKVRAGAARNPNMPTDRLLVLATDSNDTVKGAVARNPSTPEATYRILAAHESVTVRKNAARRRDIPADVAASLAGDSDRQVRSSLAKNRTTATEVVDRLTHDPEQSVRAAAARNPNVSPALLREHLSRDRAPGVRAAVARNENTSLAVLTRLSSDPDAWVRRNVAWNPQTPATLLYCLGQDNDEGVRSSALRRSNAA